MADNVTIPASGTGTATPAIATDDVGGVHYQKMKLDLGGDGVSVPVTGTVPVSGTVSIGAGPFAVTAAQLPATLVGGRLDVNVGSSTSLAVTGPLTDTQLRASAVPVTIAANSSVNVAQVNGVAPDIGAGNAGTGTLRVVLATDQPQTTLSLKVAGNSASAAADSGNPVKVGGRFNSTPPTFTDGQRGDLQLTASGALKVDGSATTQPVSGTVTTTPPANASTNVAQIAGTAASVNSGAKDAGTLRVTLATDQVQLTNALKVDGSAVTQPVSGTITANAGTGNFTVVNGGTFAVQDSEKLQDRATFTQGTSKVFPAGFIFDDVAGTLPVENQGAAARINVNRAQVGVIEDGTTRAQYAAVTASNALKVDGSAVTQPVSGTVTANLGTLNGAALDASVTGLQVAQGSTTSGQKGGLSLGAVTTGNPTYTTAQTSPLSLDTAGALRVRIAASDVSSSGGTYAADGATYTAGTTAGTPMMGARDDTSPGALAEDKVGIVRLSTRREMYTTIRDAAGNERGVNVTAGGALQTDGSATTQPVSGTVTANAGTGTFTVSGTVTANAGTGNFTVVQATASNLNATVVGTGTLAVQDSQVVADNAGFTDGTTKVFMGGYIFDEVAGTALTENDAAAARIDSKRAIVNVIEDASTRGQRMTVTAAGAAKVDGSAVTQPVSGTVTANAGTGTFGTNLAQVAGTTTDTNSGNKSAGTQRIVIATDQPALTNALKVDGSAVTQPVSGTVTANQGGTWTVQPGNTANATPWLVTPTPGTGGGWSKWSTPKDNSNTALVATVVTVKASAGTLGGYIIYNPNASAAYVQIFDVSGTVTLNTTRPDMVIPIPATSGANIEFTNGVNFANAIKAAATTTDSGSTAPGTGLTVTFIYK